MKRSSFLCIALVIAGSLAGCASTQSARQDKPLMQRATEVDVLYVGYVDAFAKRRGTRVVWVNPPKKTVVTPIASTN
ncbi:hypothetical protein [Pseudoxanthomonas japonensis]|uniref:Lipoprotein n=1 Tax=Pseudoxanthomonas japonensis TaxID=69284 RepID=A0ABQ6ZKV3_9GAMM|nr:hypothetical protein [Pseudoxanthomonas japonensis]KAF1726868.1 hypothetical protein CSC78_01795 [Pseudoxanthomonas japonensis]